MDVCLLCLESVKDFDDSIEINSEKWNQQNMQDLINTHLWPMQQTNISSWICMECGRVLYDFHIFYNRIESAQQNYNSLLKNVNKTSDLNQKPFRDSKCDSDVESCIYKQFNKNNLEEIHIKPHIIMEQPLPTEFLIDGPYIKCEEEDNLSGDVISNQKQNIKKRGRPSKDTLLQTSELRNNDPLRKRTKFKAAKNRKNKELVNSIDADACEIKKKLKFDRFNNSPPTLLDVKKDNASETDPEQQVSPTKTTKKKNHRNLDKKTLQEYDKIIAECFKIFCNLCQIEVKNFLLLRKHFKTEHKQRGYARCCKRNFFTRSLLVDHIHVHLNPEYFKCDQCKKVFSDRSRFLCHKKLHEDDSKLDKCDICGKMFTDKGALKKHVMTHSSEKLFPCTICSKFFTNSFILNHHIEAVHQNKFVQICDICGKSIRCPTAFGSHMEKHNMKTTPISCDVCGLLLTNKEGLKRHKNSQHPEGGKKEHTCHICAKVSPTQRALKSHIRSVHEQGFDFKCSLCEKSFKRPAVLRDHMASHTGTALYTCLWCPRTFISNGNMYNHRKNAHPKEWEELKRQKYALTVS